MGALYKIQVREHQDERFRDYDAEWCPCADCISKLHKIFNHHPEWDLQVVDETEKVVTSTLDESAPRQFTGAFFN